MKVYGWIQARFNSFIACGYLMALNLERLAGIGLVRVYRTLRFGRKAPPLYSVMHRGRVIARVPRVLLTNCQFVVRESGRQRVLREQRKNVHAFVVGYLTDEQGAFGIDATGRCFGIRITYNPYRSGSFEGPHGPVKAAWGVLLNEHGISACYID